MECDKCGDEIETKIVLPHGLVLCQWCQSVLQERGCYVCGQAGTTRIQVANHGALNMKIKVCNEHGKELSDQYSAEEPAVIEHGEETDGYTPSSDP